MFIFIWLMNFLWKANTKWIHNPEKKHILFKEAKKYTIKFLISTLFLFPRFFLAHKSRLDRKFISWYCAGIKKSLLYPWLELVVFYSFFVELFVLALAAKHINYFIVMAFLTQINFVGLMWLCKQRFKNSRNNLDN